MDTNETAALAAIAAALANLHDAIGACTRAGLSASNVIEPLTDAARLADLAEKAIRGAM